MCDILSHLTQIQYWYLFQYFKVAILMQSMKNIYWKHILLYDGVNYLVCSISTTHLLFHIKSGHA